MDWSGSRVGNASLAAALTTSLTSEVAAKHIPQRELQTAKRSHPWLTDDIVALVAKKQATAGTIGYADAVKACSAAIMKLILHTGATDVGCGSSSLKALVDP